ncbi:MAG: GDP-mannose 4,6-dehydratase [Gemmatimonadaceae bacterium]
MTWQGRTVLVTGAAGFIGSHLVERLLAEGADVRAFVHYNSRGHWGHLEDMLPHQRDAVEIVSGDLRDLARVDVAVAGSDVVFHLGALIAIPYSYAGPQDVVTTNVLGTLNILEASRRHGTQRVVHTSTSEVYGTAQYVPIDEQHPLVGQSPYAASKIGADQIAISFHRSFQVPVSIARPFNTYGPRQSARAVIPAIIVQALTQDHVMLGATFPTRDLNFVADTVDGFLRIGEAEGSIGEVINLATSREVSVGDLAAAIIRQVGRDIPIVFDATRVRPDASEVERLMGDASKAKQLVEWEPRHSLDEGLRITIEWIRQHLDQYKPTLYAV